MHVKKILVSGAAAAALLLASGVAADAQYIGGNPTTTSTTQPGTPTTQPGSEIPIVTVVRGQRVDVTGNDCGAGDTVTITMDDGSTLASTTAASDGTFATSVVIPSSTSLGEHLLTASCAGTADQFLRVNVIAATVSNPTTSNNTPLARTGSDTAPLVGIGAAALVLGGAFVYGARRPRNA